MEKEEQSERTRGEKLYRIFYKGGMIKCMKGGRAGGKWEKTKHASRTTMRESNDFFYNACQCAWDLPHLRVLSAALSASFCLELSLFPLWLVFPTSALIPLLYPLLPMLSSLPNPQCVRNLPKVSPNTHIREKNSSIAFSWTNGSSSVLSVLPEPSP